MAAIVYIPFLNRIHRNSNEKCCACNVSRRPSLANVLSVFRIEYSLEVDTQIPKYLSRRPQDSCRPLENGPRGSKATTTSSGMQLIMTKLLLMNRMQHIRQQNKEHANAQLLKRPDGTKSFDEIQTSALQSSTELLGIKEAFQTFGTE